MITNNEAATKIATFIANAPARKKHTTDFMVSDTGHGRTRSTFVYGTGYAIVENEAGNWTGYYHNRVLQHEVAGRY